MLSPRPFHVPCTIRYSAYFSIFPLFISPSFVLFFLELVPWLSALLLRGFCAVRFASETARRSQPFASGLRFCHLAFLTTCVIYFQSYKFYIVPCSTMYENAVDLTPFFAIGAWSVSGVHQYHPTCFSHSDDEVQW